MDTKLKNRHKLAVVLIILAISFASLVMIQYYGKFYREIEDAHAKVREAQESYTEILDDMICSSYVLYYADGKSDDANGYLMRDDYVGTYQTFENLAPYMDYVKYPLDESMLNETTAEDSTSDDGRTEGTDTRPSKAEGITAKDADEVLEKWDSYALGVAFGYDENGMPYYIDCTGEKADELERELRYAIGNETTYDEKWDSHTGNRFPEHPQNVAFYYGMTDENLSVYMENQMIYEYIFTPEIEFYTIFVIAMLMMLLAMWLPSLKSLQTGEERIFHAPLELVLVIACCVFFFVIDRSGWVVERNGGRTYPSDFLLWAAVFAIAYWIGGCARQIYTLGIRGYLSERVLLVKLWKKSGLQFRSIYDWIKAKLNQFYHSFDSIDLKDKNTKAILKIVAANFCILLVCCLMWVFGVFALIIYSVILFFILRRYFDDLRTKYALLLEATGEIAKGNLDVEIKEDLGIFSPFRKEIQKIQTGFKKAVKEEVKSQRMKTELITNVSHDLKTPLTAIITYVNLLKEESDEEKRNAYIDVLEQKSMRLKALIEDLFEISKANSDNISLNLVSVDIVNLFKQVELELDEKLKAADLSLRTSFTEEKVILLLDSQKTYRIFENLLVNVAKYAMPHTRVYVEIVKEENEVVIRLKNISASELNFNPDEITERFVRGDVSRNTEGSGLGLAIVKSFVELQKGTFKVITEADLFKAEIRWPLQ